MNKLKIIYFTEYYEPGYLAGGPIKSVKSMSDLMCKKHYVDLLSRNHDIDNKKPYKNIESKKWNVNGKKRIFYYRPSLFEFLKTMRSIRVLDYDIVHFNSFFSFWFTILPIIYISIFSLISSNSKERALFISPRGEFSQSALGIKYFKKKCYLKIFKIFKTPSRITFIASSKKEFTEISSVFGSKAKIKFFKNLPSLEMTSIPYNLIQNKTKNTLKIIFLSRICEMKNLIFAIDVLSKLKIPVKFDIFGPIEDKGYYSNCLDEINKLPSNIDVSIKGPIPSDDIPETFSKYDLFFLPTLGENFGQVIWESLYSSLPVLISDNTPWKNLSKINVGWDIPLSEIESYINVLNNLFTMNEMEHSLIRKNAHKYAKEYLLALKEADQILFDIYSS